MLQGLHHAAYRCRASAETRRLSEDLLGLPLVKAFEITPTQTGSTTPTLHSLYRPDYGGCIAFFDAPDLALVSKGHT